MATQIERLKWAQKDPEERLDYEIEWSGALMEGEDIQSLTWLVPVGLISENPSWSGTRGRIWLTGGTHRVIYGVGCRITTSTGRIHDRTVKLLVLTK